MADEGINQSSLFDLSMAGLASPGHFDELRQLMPVCSENATLISDNNAQLTLAWGSFFENIADLGAAQLSQRQQSLARQLRDNGVTYNVYADEGAPQRHWALDLFPFIIEPASWQQIELGVLQRMRLLECVMADVYGPQQLLERGMLPPALVQGHPGYLRSMHGVSPVGGTHLHVGAFDLGRGPDGNWWLLGQRFQTPSGLGYLLENRLTIASQFPQAFQELRVQRLASTYRALMESLKQMSPAGTDSHLALLTLVGDNYLGRLTTIIVAG